VSAGFTRGPWRTVFTASKVSIYGYDGRKVTGKNCCDTYQGRSDAEANAHLIAAAPDLFEACALLDAYLYATAPESNERQIVLAAIAKARGEA